MNPAEARHLAYTAYVSMYVYNPPLTTPSPAGAILQFPNDWQYSQFILRVVH